MCGALPPARHERRHGDQVIRVARTTQPEQDRERKDDPDWSAISGSGHSLVEAEHRIRTS
jgi:hypothetical protein